MVSRTRLTDGRANGNGSSIDPCVAKIEALWDRAGDSVEKLAKTLRLLVFYTRTTDGVPEKYQKSVRTKIAKLKSMLDDMTLEDAQFAIPVIKFATRQLRTYVVYGTKFKSGVSASDAAKVSRIGKRIELIDSGPADFKPEDTHSDYKFDGFSSGELDDEEFH